jgi:hypothetical protein
VRESARGAAALPPHGSAAPTFGRGKVVTGRLSSGNLFAKKVVVDKFIGNGEQSKGKKQPQQGENYSSYAEAARSSSSLILHTWTGGTVLLVRLWQGFSSLSYWLF